MSAIVRVLTWVSGLVVWVFLGAAALWPALVPWEDMVFLGPPVLLMPQLLYTNDSQKRLDRLARAFARVAILAFVTLAALLVVRHQVNEVWFVGLVGITLLAGPAMAAQASSGLRLCRTIAIHEGCGLVAGMLWPSFLVLDMAGHMALNGWIGTMWLVMHSVYAIGTGIRGHRKAERFG
ncbi:MAG: hypothetical protein OXM02_12980 [Bacteroidota bacterium]|nr:hypothetical protein [Bacteroidota bacterium]MDE2835414.1 hypothetical protein [Bacteroidota bacterium]MDE2955772.1 hypothetical protein [Bacteroidota bacterium]